MSTLPGYYTVEEAAQVLERDHSQVSRYISRGLLPAIDLGHQKLLEQSAVHKFVPPPRGNPGFRKPKDDK